MNKNRLILAVLLTVFVMGMVLAPVTASHTFHKGKYKLKVSNSKYKKLKKIDGYAVCKKVGTVKKTVWFTKKMKTYETWTNSNGYIYKSKSWNPYNKWGYKIKYLRSVTKYYSDGDITWEYYKVPKKVKKPVYIGAYHDSRCGDHKFHVALYDFKPF